MNTHVNRIEQRQTSICAIGRRRIYLFSSSFVQNRFKTAEFRLFVHAHTDTHVSVIVIYAANDGEEFKMIKNWLVENQL